MNASDAVVASRALACDDSFDKEFEERLADCPTLAYRVSLGVLRNQADAEDVAQEAMLRAYRNFHQLRDRERFRGWLVRTAWRLALDRIRASGRREKWEVAATRDQPTTAGVENVAASREFQRHVGEALDALPEKLRLVMILAVIEGNSVAEIATLMGLPEGTVKSRLFNARKKLGEKLEWLRTKHP